MSEGSARGPVVFRVSRIAYIVVVFVAACIWPFALYSGISPDGYAEPAKVGPLVVLFLIPILAIVFIARTATLVDGSGLTVRAAFGSRRLSWDDVRGLSINGANVYAVVEDGAVRLPCVHVNGLSTLARASGGRVPAIADPKPKFAPSKRSRR